MLDREDCRAKARQLIVLANASASESERETYYALAQTWLMKLTIWPGLQVAGELGPAPVEA